MGIHSEWRDLIVAIKTGTMQLVNCLSKKWRQKYHGYVPWWLQHNLQTHFEVSSLYTSSEYKLTSLTFTGISIVSWKRAHYRTSAHSPPPSLALISFWGLNLIWKNAHLAQALQIGNSHCLAGLRMWWDCFTHSTSCKLHCIYTRTRCLVHDVTHYLHCTVLMPVMLVHPLIWA